MTAKLILALCFSWAISSCDLNEDLIYPKDTISDIMPEVSGSNLDRGIQNRSGIDTCMAITTTHWLTGTGVNLQSLKMAGMEPEPGAMASAASFAIRASGDAMSEDLARGFTHLDVVYSAHTGSLTGTLMTQFYFGEVLELNVKGNAGLYFDGQVFRMSTEAQEGILRTSTESMYLVSGEVQIALILNSEGGFTADIQTAATLCIQ